MESTYQHANLSAKLYSNVITRQWRERFISVAVIWSFLARSSSRPNLRYFARAVPSISLKKLRGVGGPTGRTPPFCDRWLGSRCAPIASPRVRPSTRARIRASTAPSASMAAVSCASPASAFTRQRRQRADLLAGPGTRPLLQKARTARREDAKLRAFCDDVRAQSPGPRPFVRQGSRKKPDVRGERARGSARKAGSSALFGPKVAEKARRARHSRAKGRGKSSMGRVHTAGRVAGSTTKAAKVPPHAPHGLVTPALRRLALPAGDRNRSTKAGVLGFAQGDQLVT